MTFLKLTRPRVASTSACKRTLSNRISEVKVFRRLISGGGDNNLLAEEIRQLHPQDKEAVLTAAGVHPPTPPPSLGLALKTKLNLTWLKLRQLKQYV